jgi:hypothetical protein
MTPQEAAKLVAENITQEDVDRSMCRALDRLFFGVTKQGDQLLVDSSSYPPGFKEVDPFYITESVGEVSVRCRTNPFFERIWQYGAIKPGIIAYAAAAAERDRLNAEYRKEKK